MRAIWFAGYLDNIFWSGHRGDLFLKSFLSYPQLRAEVLMNVYSVRLIPQLKIKFCQLLGIASTMAIEELGDRLRRIDQKMDRFDAQLRRIHRRQLALEAAHAQTLLGQKKKRSESKAPSRAAKKRVKNPKKQETKTVGKVRAPAKAKVRAKAKPSPSSQKQTVNKLPAVLMLQTSEQVNQVVKAYFGKGVETIELKNTESLPEDLEQRKILAVFFERNLLAQEKIRSVLVTMQEHLPETRFIGLSNYLTLALAKATDADGDFETFLTQPLSLEDLEKTFSGKLKGKTASGGKD